MAATLPTGGRGQWTYRGLAAGVAVMWLALLPLRPLFNPDEGRYAEIPREMLAGGDWVIPHLNGVIYLEKPPLQYWATAAALRLFGQSVFAARIYTSLCALGTLLAVWCAGRRLWGAAAAWRATAVLAGMLLFPVLGQLLTLDMSLTFYMTVALAGFLMAQAQAQAPASGRTGVRTDDGAHDGESARRRGLLLLAWLATALGVLTKGLVAAAIPAIVLTLYTAMTRDTTPWRRLSPSCGLPVFLAVSLPWHWLAARRLPDFLQFFFVHEHVSRFLTPSADREEAWWFFAAVFLLGSIPWTFSGLRMLCLGWRRRMPRGQFDPGVFLWVWVVFIGLFFSWSDSKLIPYLLPALPAVALGIAAAPGGLRREMTWTALFTVMAAFLLAASSLYGPRFIPVNDRGPYFALLAKPLAQVAALLAASGLYVLLERRRDTTRAAVFLGAGWCLAGLLLMRAAAVVAPLYSGVVLARAAGVIPPGQPIYSVGTYDQTLPFYWRRTLKLVAYRGELDFGLRHDPGAENPSVEAFVEEWRALPAGYAVMEKPMFHDLEGRGVPMRELAHDVHRVLVARR